MTNKGKRTYECVMTYITKYCSSFSMLELNSNSQKIT